MVERRDRPGLTLFVVQRFEPQQSIRLEGDALHHAHVRRARPGEGVRLVNGAGSIAFGEIVAADRADVSVTIHRVAAVGRPSPLEMIVPVADRDRMLLAAEKCVELQVTAWRPAYFARSRSVTPRGEGARFREKVTARMQSALEQSGGAWMPEIHDEVEAGEAMAAVAATGTRLIMDVSGAPIASLVAGGAAAVAVGPEGGLEPAELDASRASGWVPASLGSTTLRFETAVIAAAATIRAMQCSERSDSR